MKRRSRCELQLLAYRGAVLLFLLSLSLSVVHYYMVLQPRHEQQLLMRYHMQQLPGIHQQIQQSQQALDRLQARLAHSSSMLQLLELSTASSALSSFNHYLQTSAAKHNVKVVALQQNTAERFTLAFSNQADNEVWQRIPVQLSLLSGWRDYLAFIDELADWRLWMDVSAQDMQTNPGGYLHIDLSLRLYAQAAEDDSV